MRKYEVSCERDIQDVCKRNSGQSFIGNQYQKIIETLMLEDGEHYDDFIRQWKRRTLTQVGYLLLNTDDRTDVDRMVETTLGPATENLQPTT